MVKDKFEIELLEDAREYLRSVDKKAYYKIIFNIDKSKKINDPELFKKLDNEI